MTFWEWIAACPETVVEAWDTMARMAWDAATLAERERCAKVAEGWRDPEIPTDRGKRSETGCYASWDESRECTAPDAIAAAIRGEADRA